MKNMEINKKLGFKVAAVLTSASMILGGLAGCGREAVQDTDTAVIEQSAEADENDDLLSNVMNQVAHRSTTTGMEPRKDEYPKDYRQRLPEERKRRKHHHRCFLLNGHQECQGK